MKRTSLIIIISLLLPILGSAQAYEIGLFLGASNYQGDLAPDIVPKESHFAIGLVAKQNLSPYFSLGYSINYGVISGNDSNFAANKARNLNFQSNLFELSGQVEFNFFRFAQGQGVRAKRFTPYVFTGISVFYFNPTTVYDGTTYNLRLYTTEGQGFKDGQPNTYNNWQVAIPVGGGFKFNLGPMWNLCVHASYRITFTDYLDDVSKTYPDKKQLLENSGSLAVKLSDRTGQKTGVYTGVAGQMRGNADNNDQYIFAGITITKIIPNRVCFSFN